MSFVGQVLCHRMVMGAWATWMVGKAATAAPAAPTAALRRKSRRDVPRLARAGPLVRLFMFSPRVREKEARLGYSARAAQQQPSSGCHAHESRRLFHLESMLRRREAPRWRTGL
jgi:hypothetical protein